MDIIIALSCIFSIIYFILFIRLCLDVSAMRRSFRDKEYNEGIVNFYKYYMMGSEHYHQAAEALTGAISAKILAEGDWNRKRMYEHLKSEHAPKFEKIRTPYPESVF